jgi:glyoxylase-like metal-dependent hydrolase (beta-lactamase superfamily II)
MEMDLLFATTPQEKVRVWLQKYRVAPGEIMDVLCLLVKTPGHTTLIDAGWGTGPEHYYRGFLKENLELAGVPPGKIDSVIISHGHPDHIGGLTDDDNRLNYPNAHYYMLKKDWDFWNSNPDLSKINPQTAHTAMAYVRKNLPAIKGLVKPVEPDIEFLPGIRFLSATGHTPGQGVVLISSGKEQLLHCADLFHHPLQVAYPKLSMALDLVPEEGIETRTRLIKQVAAANLPIFACHFPFPGLGRLVPQGDTFAFEAMKP